MRHAHPADEPHGPLIDVTPAQLVWLDLGSHEVKAKLRHWRQWESGWSAHVEWTEEMLSYTGWYPAAQVRPRT